MEAQQPNARRGGVPDRENQGGVNGSRAGVPRYRLTLVREGALPPDWHRPIGASPDVAALLAPEAHGLDREVFWTLLLDGRNRAIGLNVVSVGSLTAALVHPREVFKPAILANAAAVILAHCHPSGDPTPSPEDIALTRRLCEAGDLLGIRVLDHVVLGHDGAYRSLADDRQLRGPR